MRNVIYKDATIENTGSDDDFPGSFRVILSAPTEDRDGETLLPGEWKQPLPEHITFDTDHGMSVESTVGSGAPSLDDDGQLIVEGTYSSLDHAQKARTLVNEKHIRTTSVAYMTVPDTTKGAKKGATKRELLNGAFVAVPSNREALVLESKGVKAGARNSATDAGRIQQIHDLTLELGASVDAAPEEDAEKHFSKKSIERRMLAAKSIAGSLEATQDRVRDALQDAYPGAWVWLRGTIPDGNGGGTAVYAVEDPETFDTDLYQQAYLDDGAVVTLQGSRSAVDLMEVIGPDPDETESTSTDGAADLPAAGDPPAAGEKAAPLSADAIEIQRRAARIRAYRNIANAATNSER